MKSNRNTRKLYSITYTTYKVKRERNAVVSLKEALEDKNFYEPVSVDIYFPERRSYRYVFIHSS